MVGAVGGRVPRHLWDGRAVRLRHARSGSSGRAFFWTWCCRARRHLSCTNATMSLPWTPAAASPCGPGNRSTPSRTSAPRFSWVSRPCVGLAGSSGAGLRGPGPGRAGSRGPSVSGDARRRLLLCPHSSTVGLHRMEWAHPCAHCGSPRCGGGFPRAASGALDARTVGRSSDRSGR